MTTKTEDLIPGWNEFVDKLRDLPEIVVAKLPERVRDDPQIRQELARKMQSALIFSAYDSLAGDVDYPFFRPGNGFIFNFGQPNADTIYRLAKVTGDGTYRLRGKRGNLRIAIIAQRGPFPCEPGGNVGAEQPGASLDHHDINALSVDGDGMFDVILSPARPEGYDGDWWELKPYTNKLWFRGVNADWTNTDIPTLSIERLDIPPGGRPRPTAEHLQDQLHWLGEAVTFYSGVEMAHIENMRKEGFINEKLTYYDTTDVVGLEGQFYFETAYELADDEALIVEATIPPVCEYWSVMLTDEVFETTDWHNNHSCLNDTQAYVDNDGKVRFVISKKDPGVPNWLDTVGHPSGQFQGRWFRSEGATLPTAKKVPIKDVRKHLPPETPTVTPQQRDYVLRQRRMWLQQHRVW
ncbi:MAG: DUF1214 domain-containing protein [Novosphingobium sp.]